MLKCVFVFLPGFGSGEYYRIQTSQENSFTKNVPSVLDSDLLKPMETGRDLQEGKDLSRSRAFHFRAVELF